MNVRSWYLAGMAVCAAGAAWLGGPPLAGLGLHVLIGLGAVIERACTASFRGRRPARTPAHHQLVTAPSLRGRAPPFPALT